MRDRRPAPKPAPKLADETARRSKRSATISLVLVAGAGAAALALGRLDPAQREEEALVYGTLGACIAERVRTAEACIDAWKAAQESYALTAPRYETEADCARHHGAGGCVPGERVTEAARGRHLPVMAAFMMGRTEAQGLPVQPLYAHAPEEEAQAAGGGHAGGYCTGSGARIGYVGGGSRDHVPATAARTVASAPRTISRGGFGGTGRATAFSGASGRSGGFGG